MHPSVLHLIVIAQIIAFQFVAVAFMRSLFSAVLLQPDGSADPASTRYLHASRRARFFVGAVLLAAVIVSAFGVPADPGAQKLGLLAVSILSSAAFVGASVQDRRALRRMRQALPGAGVRRASLQPRRIGDWYPVTWEGLPIVILLATVIATVALGLRIGTVTTGMWVLLVIQIAFVLGALATTIRGNIGAPDVSRRLPGLGASPEKAVAFGTQLVGLEMKAFMVAKISVALLLGVGLVENGLSRLGEDAAAWFAVTGWVLVALLLLLFTAFVSRLVLMVRRVR